MPILGERLQMVRVQRGFTQQELAKLCGIGSKQIWRYENKQGDPSADHTARIARYLQVSADYLLGLSDSPDEYLDPSFLSPEEWRMIAALRAGNIDIALDILRERFRDQLPNKSMIPSSNPASHK
jgi:transcriptional regulator with XRE-family HTH domain